MRATTSLSIMATGVEVAGLVLGSLPIVLAGLEFYARGIKVSKRFWRWREEVNGLVDELRAENAVYQNSIETLLLGVVDSKDVTEFLANPGGKLWMEATFERKLKRRLGTSYDPYLNTISRLRTAVEDFKKRLELGNLDQVQSQDRSDVKPY